MATETALYSNHLSAGATMVEFAGYKMPLQYRSIREEHVAVREQAGLFDLSHMGEVAFEGSGTLGSLQRIVTNDVAKLSVGAALYSVMCNEAGGIVDDVIVYRDGEDKYMVVVNAACREKDVAWMREHLLADTNMRDDSDATALLAVQGPLAVDIVETLTSNSVRDIPPFHFIKGKVAEIDARISRTGYTGEDGFELYVDNADAPLIWDTLLTAGEAYGLVPCGLGARDTLRLESGLRLYGQDMDDTVDPFSCGLRWTVKMEKGEFIGSAALQKLDPRNPPRRFVGLELEGRAIARHGQSVMVNGAVCGEVTSGTFGFTVGRAVATAYVPSSISDSDSVSVDIRGTATPAHRVPLPFYRRPIAVSGGH